MPNYVNMQGLKVPRYNIGQWPGLPGSREFIEIENIKSGFLCCFILIFKTLLKDLIHEKITFQFFKHYIYVIKNLKQLSTIIKC